MFALEEIELDRVGVVGRDENEVFGKAHSAGAVGGPAVSRRSGGLGVLMAVPGRISRCSHVVCQATVGQVVGALAQAKRHGNMPLHRWTSPVEPHPWGHGLRPPMLTRRTLVPEALTSSLLGCLLRTSFGIGIVGGYRHRRERLRALLTCWRSAGTIRGMNSRSTPACAGVYESKEC